MLKFLGKLVDSNEKEINKFKKSVDLINELEGDYHGLSDTQLRAKTDEFRSRLSQATAEISQPLAEARTELEEVKQQMQASQDSEEKSMLDMRCQHLNETIERLEKELKESEKKALDELVPEAFAAVREAARRKIGQRHFDVQLIGGMVLHQGKIAEMKTGEGKTLSATLPLYLNSLTGRGCHLVTVNDYLSRRDCHWMGPIFDALGVKVASIHGQTPDNYSPSFVYDSSFESPDPAWKHLRPCTRKEAYEADITYGTNNEFGFDYLRDNMVIELSQCVQRQLNYAIVDEVDNLLIDEARTPLIISGQAEEAAQKYHVFAGLVPRLQKEKDYVLDEKLRSVNLTDEGIATVERALSRDGVLKSPNLYDPANYVLTSYLDNALKAHVLYRKDRDYVVKDGEVIIVDEFTGRLMFGRRYSEGLHQAIEAKERVKVQRETMTYATVTFQNYFRMYHKLAGMTGTALTEAEEFHKIYKLEVVVIPTNKPMVREDTTDRIYKDEKSKFNAVTKEIEELHKKGQPVLVGTVSIEKSEQLSDLLKRRGIPHQVLNAKNHEKEANIIADAGKPGAVTVATNMAGRGVDIILGGKELSDGNKEEWQKNHDKVVSLGGLHVLGTERHEARRIDNQLRGRSGRQGDPGSSRFYVSLDDDVVKRFGGDRVKTFMEWAGMEEDTPIENKLVNRAIEGAQVRVEGYHFDMRKHLVEYDDVVNKHREVIYAERKKLLSGADLRANIMNMVCQEIQDLVSAHTSGDHSIDYDLEGLIKEAATIFPLPPNLNIETLSQIKPKEIEEKLTELAAAAYEQKEQELGAENMRLAERVIMLRTIDSLWVDHLTAMENMRQGIGLVAVGQRDPLVAYKTEGHAMFQNLLSAIQNAVVHTIFHVAIERKEAPQPVATPVSKAVGNRGGAPQGRQKVAGRKVGRNDPCPCGSGKKYKHCCGK
ncbi:MAG: preprotein translocase subunit SecA [Chloroflexi bacterium]|nr:preprotein translocase subunit SecA [Chloroflexota bacterium]